MRQTTYALEDVISDDYADRCRVRYDSTMKRVRIVQPSLDVGEPNALSEALGITINTAWDLNRPWPREYRYSTITCFEVLEHIQNPLLLLEEIHRHLTGRLILTTPVAWLGKGEHHFHEFTRGDLYSLFRMARLEIVRLERIRAYTWDWRYFGVRPVIRLIRDRLLGQCWYVEAVRMTGHPMDGKYMEYCGEI